MNGHLKVVECLIEKGASLVTDKYGRTPLDLASQKGYTNIVEFLRQVQLDRELLTAVQDGDFNKVKSLVNQNADINTNDKYGWTPLHFAASGNKLDIVEFLFDKNAAAIKAKDVYGNTPLHVAAQYSSKLEIVKFLLDKDASGINNITNNGWTPLHLAVQGNKSSTVKLFLDRSASIGIEDKYGRTPLGLADQKGYTDIVKILKQAKLDQELFTAVENSDLNRVTDLVKQGANINAEDRGPYGRHPIHVAAENNNKDIIEFFLSRKVSVNDTDKYGWTPLHWAASKGHLEVVKFLIAKGADVNAENAFGKKPIYWASEYDQLDVVKYLEENRSTNSRRRRHHHGDHAHHHMPRKPLAIDLSNQPEIAASSGTRLSSWINDLFGWVKGSVGGLFYSRAALSEEASNTASSIPQVDEQFAKASVSSSSSTSTTLPSDGTDKKQENGGFFRDNIDYVNANIKQMRERQTPVKFKPSGGNTILEMGDHYLSQVDFNGTIILLDLLIRKVTGQKYISTVDQSISPLEAQGYALNITEGFEKVVEQAGLKSGVSMHRLNIDFVEIQKEVTGKIMSGKFDEISGVLNSYLEEACPGREAGCPGKLSPKKFDKFIAQFNKGLLNQSIEQILHNRDGKLEVDGTKKQQMSLEPQSYLSNASVHSHSKDKVSTCLSDVGVTKLGNTLSK